MSEDEAVVALAREAGLEVAWTDARGARRTVGIETLRAVLAALNLPAGSRDDIKESHVRLRHDKGRRPPLIIARAGETVSVDGEKFAEIAGEDGKHRTIRLHEAKHGHACFHAPRQPGYYRVESGGKETALAVAPARAVLPDDIAGHRRLAGISVQIYSLRGGVSGDFGDFAALGSFALSAGRAGFDAVMASPAHALFGAGHARFSPYSPSTRLFLNPLFADATLAHGPKLEETRGKNSLIDWRNATARKQRALRKAFAAFLRAGELKRFELFCREGGGRLLAHALFETLDAHFRGTGIQGFRKWPAGFESPAGANVAGFAKEHRKEIEYQLFLQWLAARSAEAAQKKALRTMAIGIVADLAVGMDPEGSHAWSAPQELLGGVHVGAPPDIFNAQGQDWGLTALSPRTLCTAGFASFIITLRAAMQYAGGIRIDHALGLRRLWVVPAGGSPAEGVYISYPEEAMMRLIALESQRQRAVVVGEDLGTVPQGFRADLARSGVLGMQVLWFERKGSDFVMPSKWRRKAMATTTTHDLPTIAGWWTERDIAWGKIIGHLRENERRQRDERAADRAQLWAAVKAARCATGDMPRRQDCEPAVTAVLAYVGKTRSTIAFAPVEDLTANPDQPNLPGTIDEHPNWRQRMKAGDLFRDPAARKRVDAFLATRKKP